MRDVEAPRLYTGQPVWVDHEQRFSVVFDLGPGNRNMQVRPVLVNGMLDSTRTEWVERIRVTPRIID